MSDYPLIPTIVVSTFEANEIIKKVNVIATGTPENLALNNILPGLISLLRTDTIDYVSIVSRYANLNVSYIIEDYLG
jgi:hypothetical protein